MRSSLRLAAGTVCVLVGLAGLTAPVLAEDAPGSGLQSFDLRATAAGAQFTQLFGNAALSGGVPYSLAQLQPGPVGYGLGSLAWPGPVAGNAGTTLIVASGNKVPQEATVLDSPVRAEARSGSDDGEVENRDFPGVVMKATATGIAAQASGEVDGATTPGVTLDRPKASSSVRLTGPTTAEGTASGSVNGIDIGGVLKIGAVRSTASAKTDGAAATAEGATSFAGVTVAGVPATIDERGLTIGPSTTPLQTKAARDALQATGIQVFVAEPVKEIEGGNVRFIAGSVVIQVPLAGPTSPPTLLSLGGAAVELAAAQGTPFGAFEEAPPPTFDTGPNTTTFPEAGTGAVTESAPFSADIPQVGEPVLPEAPAAKPEAPATDEPLLAAPASSSGITLPGGLPLASVLMLAAGTALVSRSMFRLPVTAAQAAPCPLEDR